MTSAFPSSGGERPTRARFAVLGFALAVTAIAYIDRVRIAIAAPMIKADLGLSDAQMGYVFSAFTLAYALFEIPSGWMADRFGPRLTLARIVIWWSLMSAATGAAAGFWSLVLIRLFFGMGEAGTFPSLSRVYSRWLPAKEHGRAFGLTLMVGALGGALSLPLMGILLNHVSWRVLFPGFSLIGVGWVLLWIRWFRDEPSRHGSVNASELALIGTSAPKPHPPVPWRRLFRNRSLIAVCLVCGSWLYGWYFWLTWLPTYLLTERGFDLNATGWMSALPLVCTAFGMVAGGWLSDAFSLRWGLHKGRRAPAVVALPLAVVAIVAGVLVDSAVSSVLLLSFAAGAAGCGITPVFAVCVEIGGEHAGVATGTMNMVGNLFGALCPIVVGQSLALFQSWTVPIATVGGFYLLAAGAWFLIDPKNVLGTPPVPVAPSAVVS
ncbi:MAG: MFS transporter [Opitutaceae bacterium]|nr:MFS transporter [Opitutaceae bacterium]